MVKKEVEEWFSKAEKDFEEAEFLFNHNRPLEHVALFLHQAVEKYLKGFLINNGWELEKCTANTHLRKLGGAKWGVDLQA